MVLPNYDTDICRTPVWTAFITHLISSRTWKWRDSHSPKTVYLADLQRYIFTEEYSPQLGPDGEHELRFKTSKCRLTDLSSREAAD